jgi:hypothetical protein
MPRNWVDILRQSIPFTQASLPLVCGGF